MTNSKGPTSGKDADSSAVPAVDVLILSLERADDTIAAVESALAQRGVRVRVIVVDQGSSELSLNRIRNAFLGQPKVRLHELSCNAGCAGGRNIGTRLATAEIVVGLDNDAVFDDSDGLHRVCAHFADDPCLGALGFRILNAWTKDLDLLTWGYPRAQLPMANQRFYTTRFVGAGHAYRRSVFEAAGGFDERLFIYMEEPDFCFRLINLGYRILYDPAVSILHKVSPERRSDWAGDRYYLFTRNRLYTEYKNWRALVRRVAPMTVGYLLRGALNGLFGQAVRGVIHAIPMCWEVRRTDGQKPPQLTPFAERYFRKYELSYTGNMWQRLQRDVLIRLQPDEPGEASCERSDGLDLGVARSDQAARREA